MNVVVEYLLQNWALILVLVAFAIMLRITVFLDKYTVRRMYLLIILLFLLSGAVFAEFYMTDLADWEKYVLARKIMMCIRYSSTPLVIALILYTLVKKARIYVFIPALVLLVIDIVSIFTGIVFGISDTGELQRGIFGYLPYIFIGGYAVILIVILILQSNKQSTEIIPIVFMALTLGSGLFLPFVLGKDYSKIFVTTIGIALFVYYVFLIIQMTKKDPLTRLLNRQAYYSTIHYNTKEITAVVSIDMNGLKKINDNEGHVAGDEALTTLASCFSRAAKSKQSVFRVGGDEFMIVCQRTSQEELKELIEKIRANVAQTKYKCAIGYSFSEAANKNIEKMVNESDELMYAEKKYFYSKLNK